MKICIFEESLVTLEKKSWKKKNWNWLPLIWKRLGLRHWEPWLKQGNVFYKSQKQSQMMMMMTKATTLSWGKHGVRRVRVRRVTRVSLSHSQRDLVAQEVGVMHQVSYQHFAEMKLKTGIIRASNSIFSFPFLFQGKKWLPPTPMLDVIFVGNFPQPPLNHSREKEWPPFKIIIAHPLGKLWMLPYCNIFWDQILLC